MAMLERWKDIKSKIPSMTVPHATKWLLDNYAERYQPDNSHTWCNIFFTDTVQKLQLPGPFHWADKKGNPLMFGPGIAVKGYELNANSLIEWFKQYGHGYGWIKVNKDEAEKLAYEGRLVAVTYHSGSKKASGHIAVLLGDNLIAQAGKEVFYGKSIESGFGNLPVEFWAHVE